MSSSHHISSLVLRQGKAVYGRWLDEYPRAGLGVADDLVGGKRGHRDGERKEIFGSAGFLGGLGGTPSVSHGLLVVSNGEQSAIKEGIGEEGGVHAGGGVIVVGRFYQVRYANFGRFDGEGNEGAEVGRMVMGMLVPLRRVGRNTVRMVVSIGAKWSVTSDTTHCRYFHLC